MFQNTRKGLKRLRGMTLHDMWGSVKRWRKSVNFITTILLYSAFVSLLCSLLLYLIENADGYVHLPFIDALFLGVSAFTASGLNSIDFSQFSISSLVMLWITVELGSIVMLTTLPSILRVRTFRKRMRLIKITLDAAETEREALHQLRMYDAVAKRANICYVIIIGCFLYWFLIQLIAFALVCADKSPWWALFHVGSAFNNAGFALSPENMIPIRNNNFLLLVFSVVMPLGNTLFPVFFRLQMIALWSILDFIATRTQPGVLYFGSTLRDWEDAVETLVDHPRDHYTHMFNPRDTFILFALWIIMTVAEFVMFIPEFNTDVFPSDSTLWGQLCIAIFQTVTVRTCGFSAMNLDQVRIGHLAFWILMMYVSTYPFIVAEQVTSSARDEDDDRADFVKYKEQAVNFVGRDLIWLYIVVIIVCFSQNFDIQTTDVGVNDDSFLRVVFEVSSAFGTVGLSLAYNHPSGVSFSGDLNAFSKFMIILTMFGGKHRGLPPSVDKSIIIQESAMLDEMSDLANPPSQEGDKRDRDIHSSLMSHAASEDLDDNVNMPLMQRHKSYGEIGRQSSLNGTASPSASPGARPLDSNGHMAPPFTSPTAANAPQPRTE